MADMSAIPEWQKCFQAGRAALRKDDYDAAVEFLGQALQLSNGAHGDLSLESAPYYLKYGQALLYKAQTERDVYAGPEGKHRAATGGEDSAEEEDEDGRGAGMSGGEGAEPVGDDDGDDLDEEEEEEGDLELAWKVLETARLIYSKDSNRSLEEVDVMTALADISLEKEQFSICITDYHSALELLESLVGSADRMLAELCFKLCMAYQLDQNPTKALSFCERAILVCRNRVLMLQPEEPSSSIAEESSVKNADDEIVKEEGGGGEPPASDSAKVAEIKDLELLLADMKEKAEELREQQKAPTLLDSLQAQNPQLLQEVRSVFAATAAPAAGGHSSEASGSRSHAKGLGESSSAFDAPKLGVSQVFATNLGVVGRGKKKAVLVPLEEPPAKKSSGADNKEVDKEGP